jgi:hypothetical protein
MRPTVLRRSKVAVRTYNEMTLRIALLLWKMMWVKYTTEGFLVPTESVTRESASAENLHVASVCCRTKRANQQKLFRVLNA